MRGADDGPAATRALFRTRVHFFNVAKSAQPT